MAGHHPKLIYNLATLKANIETFKRIFPNNVNINYATMANSRTELLAEIHNAGLGFFVNSLKHLRLLKNLNFLSNGVVFAASGNTALEIEIIAATGAFFYADSINQALLYEKTVDYGEFGIRVRLDSFVKNVELPILSRIGISSIELDLLSIQLLQRISSVHVYCGTNSSNNSIYLEALESIAHFFKSFKNVKSLNISGGFPAMNDTKSVRMLEDISDFWYGNALNYRYHLYLEPGRSIVDDVASFFVQVTDIKKVGDLNLAIVNSSYTCYPRKVLHKINEENVIVLGKEGIPRNRIYHVCGHTTYSNDILTICNLPELSIDDILVFNNAGAYIENSYIEYLGEEKPKIEFKRGLNEA